MFRPIFNFFITQADGTIFGSAVNPGNNEPVAFVIAPDGSVAERDADVWHELPAPDAIYIRTVVSQVYHNAKNYLTKQKLF